MNDIINICSHRFENGVVVVNATDKPLTFVPPGGTRTVVLSSATPANPNGELVIKVKEKLVNPSKRVSLTVQIPCAESFDIIRKIKQHFSFVDPEDLMIVAAPEVTSVYRDTVYAMPIQKNESLAKRYGLMSVENFGSKYDR